MTRILIHAYCTHREPPPLHFPHRASAHFDRSSDQWCRNVDQFRDFCVGDEGRLLTPSLQQVLGHIDRTRHHFSFEIDADHFGEMSAWCWAGNAIVLLPDGTVRDPAGNVLVDPESGCPHPKAVLPYPPDARQRKSQNELWLRNRLIDVPDSLPPIVAEVETTLRGADDVAWRSLAVFLVAVRSESVLAGKVIPSEALRERSPLAFHALTPSESTFLDRADPPAEQASDWVWRYEALYVLQWALGLHEELSFPDQLCEVPVVAGLMLDRQNASFVASASLRSLPEVLDVADKNYRMLWAARDAAVHQQSPPAAVNGYVLSERQQALNWLVRFPDVDWDDVDTPT